MRRKNTPTNKRAMLSSVFSDIMLNSLTRLVIKIRHYAEVEARKSSLVTVSGQLENPYLESITAL